MIRFTQAMKILSIVAAACALAACTGGNEPTASSPTPSAQTSGGGAATPPVAESSAPPEQSEPAGRPQTASFELMTGEGYRQVPAVLHHGEDFSLYVFEGFGFDKASDRLSLTANDENYVDIERLSEDADLKALRESAEQEFKEFGSLFDYSGQLVEHPLGHAELYLQYSGTAGVHDFIVWKSEAGDRFAFRLHHSKREEASAFAAPVWESLSTVQGE